MMIETPSHFRIALSSNWRFLCLLLFAVIVIVFISSWFLFHSYSRLTTTSTLQQAELLTLTLKEIRTFYTREVIGPAVKNGMLISHDYMESDDTLLLPAALSMPIGNNIGRLAGGAKSRLYSPYPFRWRGKGGLNDEFKKDAWEALSRNPEQPFYRFERLGNETVLRYASADVMRQACLNCHNTHPDTPKSDWKLGELRGILEVVVPSKELEALASDDHYIGTAFISLIFFFSLFVVIGIVSKLHNHSIELEEAGKHYDPLTGLYNRRMLIEHIRRAIAHAKRSGQCFSLMYFDLDNFKKINDTFGHCEGDRFLQEVSKRIENEIRDSDILARMGGDEFVLMVDNVNDAGYLSALASKIMKIFAVAYFVGKQPVYVTASIGIAAFPGGGETPEELLQNSDTAMFRAKGAGRNNFMFYSEKMNEFSNSQLQIESEIRSALKNNEFELYFQPKFDPITGKVRGAEALIRWLHPQKGLIPPFQFIPIAEKSDLIIDIGKWVRVEVFRQMVRWKENSLPPIKISINVSEKEFMRREVLQHLIELFLEYDVEQKFLELEITANTLIESIEEGNTDYEIIDGMDIGLSVDDFGTGFCSLGYLKNYPIDTLKIDKSFVDNIATSGRDGSLVKAIILMAHSLDMSVVAEGVETLEQKEFLLASHCDQIQGYYYSRPLPVDEFESCLRSLDNASSKHSVIVS